ncbi:hypothetical protein C2845_PM01G48870 [Panicum miliaceum]|uniref:Uncharacterized protein n=1 Tax=Panicum miliaceum TaxID=4540 RepID=A0A3L6TJW3_PANMI|nr:hypothetical protein C2845_PM01G48870 [Panicum miliaceum]
MEARGDTGRGDAFLVTKLEVGEEPSLIPFNTVPIWVQFHKIPFYLLSKKLAKSLGEKIGDVLLVDVNSHGDIGEKFIRARVLLPLNAALQKMITLFDEATGEEVETTLRLQGKQHKEATPVQLVVADEVANGMATLLMNDKNNTTEQATVADHVVQMSAAAVQPVNSPMVPTGEKELWSQRARDLWQQKEKMLFYPCKQRECNPP